MYLPLVGRVEMVCVSMLTTMFQARRLEMDGEPGACSTFVQYGHIGK